MKRGNTIEPNDLRFEDLKQYSRSILYQKNDSWEQWVESVQKKEMPFIPSTIEKLVHLKSALTMLKSSVILCS